MTGKMLGWWRVRELHLRILITGQGTVDAKHQDGNREKVLFGCGEMLAPFCLFLIFLTEV